MKNTEKRSEKYIRHSKKASGLYIFNMCVASSKTHDNENSFYFSSKNKGAFIFVTHIHIKKYVHP